jgi:type I restriction enzyme S subunit
MKFRWETEFKETEIGEIPREWEVYPLGEVVEDAIVGSTPLKKISKYWANGTIPWLTNKEVEYGKINYIEDTEEKVNVIALEETNLRLVPPNSLIISFTASVGKVVINKVPITTNQQFISFVLKSIPDTVKYLGYFFLLNRELIESFSGATPFSFITKEKALQIPIIFPPLSEQSRIATVLSWFDDLIEVKKRQNEILEKTAIAIFKSWFIDFEPFRDGEFVYSEEVGKEIPKGWEVDKTTKLIDYNPSVSIEEGKIFPFVEMKDVSTNSLICDFSFKTFTGSGVRYFGGDTLIARITPSLEHGKTAFVWFISEKEKGFGSTEFFVLHPKKSYLKEFIYLLAKSNDFRETAINSMSGTSGRQRADINALKNYLIPIPPSHALQSFHSLVEPLFQKIILNQKQIMTLWKIRDTLLPLLVFGKLRVEEV